MPDGRLVVQQFPAPDMRYTVNVYSSENRPICWCGPYQREDVLKCCDVFVKGGFAAPDLTGLI